MRATRRSKTRSNTRIPWRCRGLLFQLTGDEQVATTNLRTVRVGFFESAMVATDEEVTLLREKAVEFLIAYRDSGAGPIETGPGDRLIVSTSLAAGQDVPEEQMELWRAELALDPWARGLKWHKTPSRKRLEEFSVTVIGAGTGGLNQAVQLKRAGFPYTVIEKDSGVGGTWFENRYPGARVDTPSRTYSHVFGVDYPFTSAFCTWTENQQYFDWIADTFDVRNDIVFNTEVRSLVWDEDAAMWEITTDGPGGERVQRSKAVVTSVGFLNQPRLPEIEGMADFQGPSWHTARWPDDIDLTGKRVAVIGTGCSGYQVVPQLALTRGTSHGIPAEAPVAVRDSGLHLAAATRGRLARPQPSVPHQLHAPSGHVPTVSWWRRVRRYRPGLPRSLCSQRRQQASPGQLHRLPGAQVGVPRAGSQDDAAPSTIFGSGPCSSMRTTACSMPSSVTM